MIPSSLRIVYCKYHFWTYCFLPSTFPMWTWLFPPGVWREISGRSKKEESHSSSTFNSDCLFRPPLLLNLFLSCLETISLISFCLRGLWGLWGKAFLRLCWWSVLGAAVFEGWIDWRRKEWSRWSCWRFLNVIDVSTGRCIRLGLMLVIRIDSELQAIRIGIPFSVLCIWKINNKIFCIRLGNHKLKIRSYFIEQYFCFKCIII